MWKRTVIANFVGIALLLMGWGLNSGLLVMIGFGTLVVSLCYRISAQVRARLFRNR
jgi:hypothetical protein